MRILLGVTGSVAAIKAPELDRRLRETGHEVRLVLTDAARYFVDLAAIPQASGQRVFTDADEWPGRAEGRLYRRGDAVLHVELRKWAELFLIAPLDAHTLAKLAGGLCDNCLTCVWRAWEPARPVVLAPAMNTLMWQHPLTAKHLAAVAEQMPGRVRIVSPVSKLLACGDSGDGAMAELEDIVAAVQPTQF